MIIYPFFSSSVDCFRDHQNLAYTKLHYLHSNQSKKRKNLKAFRFETCVSVFFLEHNEFFFKPNIKITVFIHVHVTLLILNLKNKPGNSDANNKLQTNIRKCFKFELNTCMNGTFFIELVKQGTRYW